MKFQRTGFPHSEVHLSFNKLLPRHQHEKGNGYECIFLPSLLVTSKRLNSCKKRKALCFWRIIHVHSYLQTSYSLLAIYSHKGEQCHKNMTFSNAGWVLSFQHTPICKCKNSSLGGLRENIIRCAVLNEQSQLLRSSWCGIWVGTGWKTCSRSIPHPPPRLQVLWRAWGKTPKDKGQLSHQQGSNQRCHSKDHDCLCSSLAWSGDWLWSIQSFPKGRIYGQYGMPVHATDYIKPLVFLNWISSSCYE